MHSHEVLLRPAQRDDMPAIEAMHFLSVHGLTSKDYTPEQVEAFIGHLGTYDPALIDAGTYFVAEAGGRIVASGGWSKATPHFESAADGVPEGGFGLSPDSAKIRSIFVHPQHTRRGLGTRLVAHSEHQAAAAGCRLLELWATLTGVPLYRKLGYQEVGRVDFTPPEVEPLTSVHMAKLITLEASAATAA